MEPCSVTHKDNLLVNIGTWMLNQASSRSNKLLKSKYSKHYDHVF